MAKQRIVFVYNTGTYLYRLRRELLAELVDAGNEVVALFPFDEATPSLMELGVRCVPLKMTAHSLQPWRELQTLLDVRAKLAQIKPDLVFAFTIKPIVYAGLTLRRDSTCRFCVMITGLGMMFAGHGFRGWLSRRLATTLYRRSLRRAGVVFMQNEEHGRAFLKLGLIREAQYQLIAGSGVNLSNFQQQKIPDGVPVFLMMTRMLEHKGVRDFIVAARALHRLGVKARFVLAGPIVEGPHSISKQTLSDWLDGSPVRYRGAVEDVAAELALATIVVLPSVYPEGVPRILLEAMAVGRPILTTDTAGCRNTVEIADLSSCKYIENSTFSRTGANASSRAQSDQSTPPSSGLESNGPDSQRASLMPTNAHPIHGTIGQNGVLCRPGDLQALTACMQWMAGLSHDEIETMGIASRELVERKFNVRDVNDVIHRRLSGDN